MEKSQRLARLAYFRVVRQLIVHEQVILKDLEKKACVPTVSRVARLSCS